VEMEDSAEPACLGLVCLSYFKSRARLRATGCHLPCGITCHPTQVTQVNTPPPYPQPETGTRFTYPAEGWKAELTPCGVDSNRPTASVSASVDRGLTMVYGDDGALCRVVIARRISIHPTDVEWADV